MTFARVEGELGLRLHRRPLPGGRPAVATGAAEQVVADGGLVHGPGVDAFEPVIEPAPDLGAVVQVGPGGVDLAVAERPYQKALGYGEVAVEQEDVAGEDVIPASHQADGHAGAVDLVQQRVGGDMLPHRLPGGYLA